MPTAVTDTFLVNTTTQGAQSNGYIADLPGGGFVIVWSGAVGPRSNPNASDVYAQVYDAAGQKIGGEILVMNVQTGNQFVDGVAATADGFVVTWKGDGDVGAQRFSFAGAKVGEPYLVNSTTVGAQSDARVASLSGGGAAVVFESQDETAGSVLMRLRVLGPDGLPTTSDALIDTGVLRATGQGGVAGLSAGGFVALVGVGGAGQAPGLQATLYSADGVATGVRTVVSDPARSASGSVSATANGGFVVAYFSSDPNAVGAFPEGRVRLFDAAGAPITSELTVISSQTRFSGLVVAGLPSGGFVVAYGGGATAVDDIYVRQFDSTGAPVGDAVLVNDQSRTGEQRDPAVDVLADGRFVVSWTDGQAATDDPSDRAVRARVFQADGTGGGTPGPDTIGGGPGDDRIDGAGGDDALGGGSGNDTVIGGVGNDLLGGGVGNDDLSGGDGNDALYGEDGNDALSGGADADLLIGMAGDDTLDGGDGDDLLAGQEGTDTLRGGDGNDALYGEGGDDTLEGGAGADLLGGGEGADRLAGGDGADAIYGGSEGDTLDGGADGDELHGESGDDAIAGGAGSDALLGEGGDDMLVGGEGGDYLDGGEGEDVLTGGAGADLLVGGGGRDVFSWTAGSESTYAAYDILADFTSGEDTLDLRALRTGDADVLRIDVYGDVTVVSLDQGGDGGVDFAIQVNGPVVTGDYLF